MTQDTIETDDTVAITIALTPGDIDEWQLDWSIDESICHEYAQFLGINIEAELTSLAIDPKIRVSYISNPDETKNIGLMFSRNTPGHIMNAVHHVLVVSWWVFKKCRSRDEWRQVYDYHNLTSWFVITQQYPNTVDYSHSKQCTN